MSVTAVPISPAATGSLVKLWGGVALAVLAAAGLAVAGTPKNGCKITTVSGLGFSQIKPGTGAKPTDSDVVLVNYKGKLAANGKQFDANDRAPFPVTQVVPGFSEGLKLMQKGGTYKLCIPAKLGYGAVASGPIPANSDLIFDVDLLDYKSMAEIQAAMQAQQAQQAQHGGAGAPPAGMPPQ
jgi:FKBP-type peptidyl-prolyl cis-trans isomerase FkpA